MGKDPPVLTTVHSNFEYFFLFQPITSDSNFHGRENGRAHEKQGRINSH